MMVAVDRWNFREWIKSWISELTLLPLFPLFRIYSSVFIFLLFLAFFFSLVENKTRSCEFHLKPTLNNLISSNIANITLYDIINSSERINFFLNELRKPFAQRKSLEAFSSKWIITPTVTLHTQKTHRNFRVSCALVPFWLNFGCVLTQSTY